MAQDHLGPWDLHLNKLGKGSLGYAITEFQASKPSGSEEEDFLIFFYEFLWLEPTTPGQKPSWTRGPTFE